MALIPLREPARRPTVAHGFALFALGFRPFYLLGTGAAALAMLAWLLVLSGRLSIPIPGVWWHAHEMLFGFAAAIIVGFLFTAGRNWTGLETPTGPALAALALVWLAGRVGMVVDGGALTALIDASFLPAAAAALARVLWKANSRKNYFIVGILGLLSAANITFHLARLGVLSIDPLQALHGALAVIIVLETAIGGRVIPSFTASAIKGVRQWQSQAWNYAAITLTELALFAWALLTTAQWPAALSLLAMAMQLRRSLGWNPWATRHTPILWILHVAHFWIPVGLLLVAGAQLGYLPRSAAVHALTIGATGGLIIGMVTRTALGHTGRMIVTRRIEVASYALVQLAAVVRVATTVFLPAAAGVGIHIAATLWILAFGLYLWRYLPWLIRPRIDGLPG